MHGLSPIFWEASAQAASKLYAYANNFEIKL